MSDSSAPRSGPARLLTPAAPAGAALLHSLAPLLRAWLPHQRWFAGKGRAITGFSLVAATELLPCAGRGTGTAPGLLHLLVRAEQPDGERDDCYQLLLGVRPVLPTRLARSLLGHPTEGPLRGRAVYEALADPRLAVVLLERLRMPGRLGALRFVREPDVTVPAGLRPRLLEAEQSNTSVVYGDTHILKIFRRVSPGNHPDLELPLALARAGCPRVPPPVAWFEAVGCPGAGGRGSGGGAVGAGGDAVGAPGPGTVDPDSPAPGVTPVPGVADDPPRVHRPRVRAGHPPHPDQRSGVPPPARPVTAPGGTLTLGVLQPYLPDACDGWRLALTALASRSDFTGASRALGRATAEVHTALARALPTVELRHRHLEALATAMTQRLEAAAVAVPALRPYRAGLRAAYRSVAELGRRGRTWSAQRVHGDLHLGQVLRSRSDGRWSLIDFEGEPARPLTERRDPQPVIRDVAGILRSFDYAACQLPAGAEQPGDTGRLRDAEQLRDTEQLGDSGRLRETERLQGWARANRSAFCQGYAEAAGADPRDDPELLRAFETDKAVYEVVYEAQHRPSWVAVPLSAIRRLAAAPHGGTG